MSWCPWKIQKITWARWFFPWFSPWFSPKFQHKVLETRSSTMPELVVGRTAQAPAVGGLSGHPVIQCDWIRGGNPDGGELRNIWYTFGIHLNTSYINLYISTYINLYHLISSYIILYPHCGWWLVVVGCRDIPFGLGFLDAAAGHPTPMSGALKKQRPQKTCDKTPKCC